MKENKVEDMNITKDTTLSELLDQYGAAGGFTARKVFMAREILKNMFNESSVNFLSFPACIVSTGTRGILRDALRKGLFQAVITTCGTLDHDLARTWEDYYHGSFDADDSSLHREGVNRLGNIFIPNSSYGEVIEAHMQPMLDDIVRKEGAKLSTSDLIRAFGERIDDERSLIHWAAKKDIPVFVPGITDGAFGTQLWMYWERNKEFQIDLMKDQKDLADLVFPAEESGALMIGGGISKHHTIWWNQFRGGLDNAVYITTAVEHDGSLSGARLREAVSWGKVREGANRITVEGDATVLLPLILGEFL